MGYLILILMVIAIVAVYFYKKKISLTKSKKLDERFFVTLTGLSAVFIIIFIAYLVIHIFLLGKTSLSWEFLTTPPKDGLTGGGIFPAIVGTSLLVMIMSIIGVPIGTITAIYLAEYAKENSIFTKSIRFAVNTLAGVPSIVFGLFGLGFFIGVVGKQMDVVETNRRLDKMEVVFNQKSSAFADDGMANGNEISALLAKNDKAYWSTQEEQVKLLSEVYGEGNPIPKTAAIKFFRERLQPRWGQPSLIWAALTMALLTLPVVIVSVEEAIKTIPRDLREASLALGATKFMTILRVVIPGALPGILTGTILTISRGAGEVAPILFTGVAYYLPDLPNTVSSQFMHLGYHIYVLATQSTNVELTKSLQYATTFVLLALTFALNFTAVLIRSKIRSKAGSHS
ncbi:MAG: PstA family ABC transporter permease [bacterium]